LDDDVVADAGDSDQGTSARSTSCFCCCRATVPKRSPFHRPPEPRQSPAPDSSTQAAHRGERDVVVAPLLIERNHNANSVGDMIDVAYAPGGALGCAFFPEAVEHARLVQRLPPSPQPLMLVRPALSSQQTSFSTFRCNSVSLHMVWARQGTTSRCFASRVYQSSLGGRKIGMCRVGGLAGASRTIVFLDFTSEACPATHWIRESSVLFVAPGVPVEMVSHQEILPHLRRRRYLGQAD